MTNDVERYLNLTISLIHPELFRSGMDMLRKIRQLDGTKDIAREWQSVYTGIAIISNRLTPLHRDSKGRPGWYDSLLSYSDNDTSPRLLIGDLGLDLQYPSGTVVGFCGTVFKHGVGEWGDGNRICYAHFMRESVRDRLGAPAAGWVYRERYIREKKTISFEMLDKDSMDLS